jgi:hypothetical protein
MKKPKPNQNRFKLIGFGSVFLLKTKNCIVFKVFLDFVNGFGLFL